MRTRKKIIGIELEPRHHRSAPLGSGYLFALLAVAGVTGLAVLLEFWVKNYNLVLLYVLVVVATGLKYGSRPAILAAVLSFLSFNFFLTDPRHTFVVSQRDELATLIFLFLIALICGPAASRIRSQIMLLRERIELTRDLESARVKTEVEQLRSALLSSVSHDLRSPLAAMMGAAESLKLLDKRLAPGDRDELVDTILQESRRLDSYIQNLLDMTRLGHGNLKIERDWVSISDIISSALARLRRYFPAVKTEYSEKSPPPLLFAHAALIEQALFNILENAARFSPPGESININVDSAGNNCVIEIEDRGPGIPEVLREQIFDMFYVVSEGDQKKQSTGMGLAICQGMVGAHGGSVHVYSGSGNKGARFVVELPVECPDNPAL
ncbi:sensor histidine kinase [Microbulbifer sp.]|uniref:sensor histidine kinase n=1 Tax=Microbulbifer sp. TaxID=1908541 RepID=UPI003F3995D6